MSNHTARRPHVGEVIEYPHERFTLASSVARALGVHVLDLDRLHESATEKYAVFRRDNDQSSEFHRRFYAAFEQDVQPDYRRLVQQTVRAMYDGPIVYQRVPTFRVHLPGNLAVGEFHRDRDYQHSPREENYWLPLTRAWGTNTIWIESEPDRGDFRPAEVTYGQILRFDGANLVHGNKVNSTSKTRVSMDFRVIPMAHYEESDRVTINTKMRFAIGDYFSLME